MNINSLRDQVAKIPEPNRENLVNCTDQIFDVVKLFPDLTKNPEENFNVLIDKIFALKEHLPLIKQKAISRLFYAVHDLNPSRFKNLLQTEISTKNWISKYPEVKAVIEGGQRYPIAAAFLKDEEMPCSEYFKSISIKLEEGSFIEVSQGLLAKFSDMVRGMLRNKEMKGDSILVLEQLNSHQLDALVAFLETSKQALINVENFLPLLQAGEYLQIPNLIEGCKTFINQNAKKLDLETITNLLNHFPPHEKCAKALEDELSNILLEGLAEKSISNTLLQSIDYLKTNLKRPIALFLEHSEIEDSALKQIKDLPISNLRLFGCKKLTKECLSFIGTMPSIKTLDIGGNPWVDNAALLQIPSSIEQLSLSRCLNVNGEGLKELEKTGIIKFEMKFCKHLKDDDFAKLPTQFQSVDLSGCSGIGVKAMQTLGKMKKLEHLVLANTSVTDAGVAFLPLQLITLDLSGCRLKDEAFKRIAKMEHLEKLILSMAQIGDKGVEMLPKSLAHLMLDDCQEVTDNGITSLANRKELKSLILSRCPKITYEAIQKFSSSVKLTWQEPSLSSALSRK